MQNANMHDFVSKYQKKKIIVLEGDNATLENILSIIEKSGNATGHIMSSNKRRKTDLNCVICENQCSGYNFNVISCVSCKSFFQRHLSQNLNDLRCLTNRNNCDIKFKNQRRMCRRCRLEKCLSAGMKRNCENQQEKIIKQQQAEENRQATTMSCQNVQQLSLDDYERLHLIKLSYQKGIESMAMKRDVSEFNHVFDQRSALLHSTTNVYNVIMRLLLFIRNIPQFEFLNEHDRFILVKSNSPLVFFMHSCINYDINRDLIIDANVENEEYALVVYHWAKSCYGEQLSLQAHRLLRSIKEIINADEMILKIMMLILLFSKSLSFEDVLINEPSILRDTKTIFETQSIYTSLLFRYMIEKHSDYYEAVRRYSQLIHKVNQMIMIAWKYRQLLANKLIDTNDDELSPVLKCILRLD